MLHKLNFPIRGFSKRFFPKRGGHRGATNNTDLCVMEALNWAQGSNYADDAPSCVSASFRALFIELNDHGDDEVRKKLFARVHRLLGTDLLPSKVQHCLAVNARLSKFQAGDFSKLDAALDDADAWFEKNNPTMAALRKEVRPLNNISPHRGRFMGYLSTLSAGKPLESKGITAKAAQRKLDRIIARTMPADVPAISPKPKG